MKHRGFSLVEVLVSIVLGTILLALALATLRLWIDAARNPDSRLANPAWVTDQLRNELETAPRFGGAQPWLEAVGEPVEDGLLLASLRFFSEARPGLTVYRWTRTEEGFDLSRDHWLPVADKLTFLQNRLDFPDDQLARTKTERLAGGARRYLLRLLGEDGARRDVTSETLRLPLPGSTVLALELQPWDEDTAQPSDDAPVLVHLETIR